MFRGTLYFVIMIIFSNVASSYAGINYANNRTTMVHLFEWKWNDIAKECEKFLGPMGFGGVQVSPIQENVIVDSRPWYERYQPVSYRWQTRSGNEEEFRSMVLRCNKVSVRIYVDVLLNHMSADHVRSIGTGGSRADPSTRDYPSVPYNRMHFHPTCQVNNFQDATNVRNCELSGLHDLDQSQEYVRGKLVEMLNKMVDSGVAGFRIDAAKHMWPEDLAVIYSRVKNLNVEHGFAKDSRPFLYQEVIDFGGEAVTKYQYNSLGAVTEFRCGREISNSLRGRNPLKWFVNWGEKWGLLPSKDAFVFIDNHDTQRTSGDVPLTYKAAKLYKIGYWFRPRSQVVNRMYDIRMNKMAVAFMLAHPYGQPRVMSSFDFNSFEDGPPADSNGNTISPSFNPDGSCASGWVCEHRWRQIYNMVGFRNFVGNTDLVNWWDNGSNQIAFCRGNRGFIAINADSTDLKQTLSVCLPPGTYCDVVTGEAINGKCSGKSVQVDASGRAYIEVLSNEFDGVLALRGDVSVASSHPIDRSFKETSDTPRC